MSIIKTESSSTSAHGEARTGVGTHLKELRNINKLYIVSVWEAPRETKAETERIKYRFKVAAGEQARSSSTSFLKGKLYTTRQWWCHIALQRCHSWCEEVKSVCWIFRAWVP